MTELLAFLRARLDEDEQTAAAASDGPWAPWRGKPGLGRPGNRLVHGVLLPGESAGSLASITTHLSVDAEHIARHDPARVLRQSAALRRVLETHPGSTDEDECPGCGAWLDGRWHTASGELCPVLADLALIWSEHPEYNPEWAPEPSTLEP